MNQPIISLKDYGSVQINLKQYMDDHHITRNALARAINARFEVVNKWYNGQMEKLDLDVLARICYVLDCSPSDLLYYAPPANKEDE